MSISIFRCGIKQLFSRVLFTDTVLEFDVSPLSMIPTLPSSCTMDEQLKFYDNMLSNLEDQSTIHTNWHTHKQNPAVCWICDIPILARIMYKLTESIITKSPLDIETELSSGIESEPEIENDNFEEDDEYEQDDTDNNEPEYDVDEDGYRDKESEE